MSNGSKLIIIIAVVGVLAYILFVFDIPYRDKIDDFATCAAAGNPVMESYPRQCSYGGVTYTEILSLATTTIDLIFIESPASGSNISSPVAISGQARGQWYFEASFPVEIVGADGLVLGHGIAQARGSWMTTEFVPFSANVSFDPGSNKYGLIRLIKDNPSGDPAKDDHLDIPVMFNTK